MVGNIEISLPETLERKIWQNPFGFGSVVLISTGAVVEILTGTHLWNLLIRQLGGVEDDKIFAVIGMSYLVIAGIMWRFHKILNNLEEKIE